MPPKRTTGELAVIIESRIHLVRGQRVMLDSDLAELYGVPTMRLNEQVSRNRDRFPEDFAFQLTTHELTDLMSQIVTSSPGYGGRRKPPWAFTEHGVAMLSGVLRSPTAVRVNIAIIRAFVRMRRLFAVPGDLITKIKELAETVQLHDRQIKAITDLLQKMMEPPAPPARRIGFVQTDHAKNSPEAKR
ncbi:MAG: ORF6N domain-containing protein [Gemmataceae bacterium]|nr:ORF6N domain-containing protein [Gemmataceae bacterium]